MRDRRPTLAAGATAVVSTALLALAMALGWLPDVGRGDGFCEAARDWGVKQPANTFSNVGFVVAGLAAAWHAGHRRSPASVLAGYRHLPTVFACVIVLLGPASAAMHATQSELGGRLDTLSMYLLASFAAAYALSRWLRRGIGPLVGAFVAGLGYCEALENLGPPVPVVDTSGNIAFGSLLVLATVLELLLMHRAVTRARRAYAYASVGCLLTAFAIWNATRTWLCAPYSPLQGHAIWHLLDAVAAYLLYRYYASEEVVPSEVRETATTARL